jgi:hypothetical protein
MADKNGSLPKIGCKKQITYLFLGCEFSFSLL